MSTPANPITGESRRFPIPLPNLLWLFLATVVLIIVAIGLQFGLPNYRQQAALREIERLGGSVQSREGGPAWLRRRIGDGWMIGFDEVDRVVFYETITDADLVHLEPLTRLKELHLGEARVTGAGLYHLRGMTSLVELSLGDTQVADVGLAYLNKLTSLQMLYLDGTPITDDGLTHLAALAQLKELNLSNTRITDAGLVKLRALTKLKSLSLEDTQITDAGLMHLKGMTNLEWIRLSGTPVTDDGRAQLKRALPNVEFVERDMFH
ncbi:MAG: hypothetical protein EXS05_02430 [Planctomycetaceae bacterium]|nr:hypothetical protein [Planctomycetaceae bacterium]